MDESHNREKELHRLHRVLFHYFRNIFIAARAGVVTVGQSLMAFHVTEDGKVLSEVVLSDDRAAGSSIILSLAPRALPPPPSGAIPLGPSRG